MSLPSPVPGRLVPPQSSGTGRGRGWRDFVYQAFVQYNPLYFASALCILAGVFLVARELPREAFASKAGIVASTEIYQFLLIAAAMVLLRAGLTRPATLLGLTCLVFMLDVAMNGERMLSHVGLLSLAPGMRARLAFPVSVALAMLGPVKLWLLASVFKLRSGRTPLLVLGLTLLSTPLLPYLTELAPPTLRQTVYLVLLWLGAPLLAWACTPSARCWTSAWQGDAGEPRLRRIAAVVPVLVAALFIAHGLLWSFIATLSLTPALAAPYLLAMFGGTAIQVARSRPRTAEFMAWLGTGTALGAAALTDPSTGHWPLAAMALLTGAVLVFLVEGKGLQVFLLATGCLFGGAYLVAAGARTPLPLPGPIWAAGLAASLLAGAIRHRDFRSFFVSALAIGTALACIHPGPTLFSYGGLMSGLWLAVGSWFVFPGLRRWVPIGATAGVLVLGAWMLWQGVPGIAIGYVGLAVSSAGIGLACRRLDFQGAGFAGGAVLAAFKHAAWIPSSSLGWGILLLSGGFVFLSAGVLVNLLLARGRPPVETPTAPVESSS
ncbi:MAG TPA: hypothetical protein VMU54_13005 [Planctomycetota bacterium]|nr:hypothetical protein [Planctomycetota bacterium]